MDDEGFIGGGVFLYGVCVWFFALFFFSFFSLFALFFVRFFFLYPIAACFTHPLALLSLHDVQRVKGCPGDRVKEFFLFLWATNILDLRQSRSLIRTVAAFARNAPSPSCEKECLFFSSPL